MYARAVEDTEKLLRELRADEWEGLGLAAVAAVASLAATQWARPLSVPLFIGGLAGVMLGVRAAWRRWDLIDRTCHDSDAYVIAEVRERAARETTMRRRRTFAAQLRWWLDTPGCTNESRIASVADDLRALTFELDEDGFELDPASGVACMRLLSDMESSPLLNPHSRAEDLRSRIIQIRSGFRPRIRRVDGLSSLERWRPEPAVSE